jgi:hypothetical protein
VAAKPTSYPFEWVRPEQCIKPLGPFGRSKFFELLRAGAFKTKSLVVGHGKRTLTLISVASVNDFLNGSGLAVGPRPHKPNQRTRREKESCEVIPKPKSHPLPERPPL